MTDQEIEQLKKVIRNYKKRKEEATTKRIEVEERMRKEPYFNLNGDLIIKNIYKELLDCPERKAFIKEVEKTRNNDEYEKIFTLVFNEIFL